MIKRIVQKQKTVSARAKVQILFRVHFWSHVRMY